MAKKVIINLPVKNLKLSISFFTKLGFSFDHRLTDELAACMIIRDNIFVMLLKDEYFKTFTRKNIAISKESAEVFISMEAESKQHIQQIISEALLAGADIYKEPEDHGWMYQHSFVDLDGHHWEFIYTDKDQLP